MSEEALQRFVADWKKELVSEKLLGKREERETENESEEENEGGIAAREASSGGEEEESRIKSKLARHREPSPLLVLPPGLGEKVLVPKPQQMREEETNRTTSPRLLDTLIADLDDINTVPFFDVKLPREVALIIFRHLDMNDLCTCSRVSWSWRLLADDNALWSGICETMGYDTSLEEGKGQVVWKTVVREIVLRRKKQLKNWKERVCGLSDLQPDTEGVLVCVHFCPIQEQILAGYSSGAVYLWTLTSEEGPMVLESGHTHLPRPKFCRISRGWAAIATESGEVIVYDTSVGGVVHRERGLGRITSLVICSSDVSLTIAVATAVQRHRGPDDGPPEECGEMTVLSSERGSDWQMYTVRPLQDNSSAIINQLSVLQPQKTLIYSTQTNLSLHPIPSSSSSSSYPNCSPSSHIFTSAGAAGSTAVINCFDHTPSVVACATSAWGYHVQIYDLNTSGHMITLRGHAQSVTALNISNSPPNTLVTGSTDRRVRVYDTRRSQPVMALSGHHGPVISAQCDDWKITSGGKEGLVVVWDRRMNSELWTSHERHPVAGLWFTSRYLVTAHLPKREAWPTETIDQSEPLHRCQRGLLRVMDFSVDPLYYTRLLPSVCSSGYDEPSRSFHHLDLKLPYDTIS